MDERLTKHPRFEVKMEDNEKMELATHVEITPCDPTSMINGIELESGSTTTTSYQLLIPQSFSIANEPNDCDSEEVNKALMLFLISDLHSLDTISSEGFQKFSKKMSPLFEMPDKNTIPQFIERAYIPTVLHLRQVFSELDFYSLTFESWSNYYYKNTRTYVEVSIHFIKEFKHCSYVIGLIPINDSVSDKFLYIQFKQLINFWNIDKKKIVACVTDHNAKVVKSVELLIGKEKHITCFGHSLNIMLKEIISEIPELNVCIAKVKEIVMFFDWDHTAGEKLEAEKKKRDEGASAKLVLHDERRWNSIFVMVERFLSLKDCVGSVLENLQESPEMVSTNELALLHEWLMILKPFFLFTVEMSKANSTPISEVIPILSLISNFLNKIVPESEVGQKLIECIVKSLDKHFQDVESKIICSAATLLDPRFKAVDFKCSENVTHAINQLNLELAKCEMPEFNDLWIEREDRLNSRLEKFLDSLLISHKKDPLKEWKVTEKFKGKLSSLALKYLCVPSTCVFAKKLFTDQGIMMCDHKSSLKPRYLEKLLIINSLSLLELQILKIELVRLLKYKFLAL